MITLPMNADVMIEASGVTVVAAGRSVCVAVISIIPTRGPRSANLVPGHAPRLRRYAWPKPRIRRGMTKRELDAADRNATSDTTFADRLVTGDGLARESRTFRLRGPLGRINRV